ncbi:hypothetical protein [Sphingobacterium griseoflavum]|nr:hypothetical protein [Sphingobacterium griseoflavum]
MIAIRKYAVRLVIVVTSFFVISCNEVTKNAKDTGGLEHVVQDRERPNDRKEHTNDSLVVPTDRNARLPVHETCQEPYGDMEVGFTTVCFWWNADLETAYARFRTKNSDNDDGRFLERRLPKTATHIVAGSYPLEIRYARMSTDSLLIDLFFPGGETQIIFEKKTNGVEVRTLHAPD